MTRYLRLGYLVPRLVLLVVLFCVLEFGSGWALRQALIGGGEQAIGARVEIGDSVVSLVEARATLKDLRIADPKRPMQNLVEADRIELDFESDSLLRRKAIAEHGSVRGLRFGTPRTTSGALDPQDEEAGSAAPAWLGDAAKQAAEKAANQWIADLENKLDAKAESFESVRLANELSEAWPARFDSIAAEARTLRDEVKRLKTIADEARRNPLRHADFLTTAPQQVQAMQQRLASLHAELTNLPADVAADKQRVELARQRDEQRLRDLLQVDQLDPQSLTSHLLGERMTASVQELIGWVRWTREMIPASGTKRATTPRDRGVDVHFVGLRRRPDLLIRELELAGTTRLAGRPVELTGVVTDFTTSPELHGQPIRAELHASGGLPLEVRATIHRAAGQPVDELLIDCPGFDLPGASLGDEQKLAMQMAPSSGSVTVSLRIEGEQLTGELQLIQDRVALTPVIGDTASPLVRRLGESVGRQVASIPKPATRVTLSGSLDQPRMRVWSTLGTAVAESLQQAALGVAQAEADARLATVRQKVSQEMAGIDSQLADATRRLSSEIDAPRQEIEQLASNWLGEQLGVGGFSLEKLGKRLPSAGSLFK